MRSPKGPFRSSFRGRGIRGVPGSCMSLAPSDLGSGRCAGRKTRECGDRGTKAPAQRLLRRRVRTRRPTESDHQDRHPAQVSQTPFRVAEGVRTIQYVDHEARLGVIEREVPRLAAALSDAPPDRKVPTCPEWTLADLARHIGEFTGFWTHVLCEGTDRPKTPYAEFAAGDPGHWFGTIGAHFIEELVAKPPDPSTSGRTLDVPSHHADGTPR